MLLPLWNSVLYSRLSVLLLSYLIPKPLIFNPLSSYCWQIRHTTLFFFNPCWPACPIPVWWWEPCIGWKCCPAWSQSFCFPCNQEQNLQIAMRELPWWDFHSLMRVENQVGSPVLEELTEEGSWEKPCGSRSSFWAARWVDVLQSNSQHSCKRTGIAFSQTVQCKAVQHIFHQCPLQAHPHLFGNQPHLRIFHLFVCLHLSKPPAWVHV